MYLFTITAKPKSFVKTYLEKLSPKTLKGVGNEFVSVDMLNEDLAT